MNDYQTLYIIAICLGIVGLGFSIKYLMDKYKIKNSDLVEGIDIAQTLLTFIEITLKDMKFGNEEEINKITKIINDSLGYMKELPDTENKKDKIYKATEFSVKMCKELNIELNEDRLYILNNTIVLAYNFIEAIEDKQIEE